MSAARIIVVDDEPDVRETFAEYLQIRGFDVATAESGSALRACLAERPADLILLDINMPDEDGLSIAKSLRQDRKIAIIMVTAASEPVDRVVGLELGADDYIGKPCDLRELLARVKSVLRRTQGGQREEPTVNGVAAPANRCIKVGRHTLDIDARRMIDQDGTVITLTSMEFDLIYAFATHPDRVLTRDQLLDLAHNRDWEPFDRSIDIRIARIRRKIERDPTKPRIIRTVRGAGYMFVPDGDT